MATPRRGSASPTRKVGTMNAAGTRKWDGKKWQPVNVARDGQRATRNGKPVVRKNGKWVPYSNVGGSGGRRGGNNRSSSRTLPTRAPGQQKDMARGVVQGDQSVKTKAQREAEAAKKRAAAVRARAKAKADAAKKDGTKKAPTAPTLPPKPRASSSSKPAASKPRPSNTAKPTQAAKPAAQTTRKPRTWLKDNYKPGKRLTSTAGKTNNKVKQTKRMATALKGLKVRSYNKKKK